MTLAVAAKIARREMRAGLRGFRIFLACVALGIAAIAAIGTVRDSIQAGLESEGATLLGGDAEIQLTYRYADADEQLWMSSVATDVSEIVDFRSMAVADDGNTNQRGLTQVKAVDVNYPLFGALILEPKIDLETALAGSGGRPGGVMEQVLADRLGLAAGTVFRLGVQEFVLTAILVREPDGTTGFSLGPRTIVRKSDLETSGLLAPGTLFESAYRLKLPPGADLDVMQIQAGSAIGDGGFRWRDRRNGAPGIAVFVERLSNFLVLVGLAGLIVGGVGVSAAVRAYLDEKTPVIAILKSTGAGSKMIFQIYLIQILAMATLGIGIGLILGFAIPLGLAPLMQNLLPVPVIIGFYPAPLFQALVYGLLVALLFSLWPLSRSAKTKVAVLFRDANFGIQGRPGWIAGLVCFAILIALIGLAVQFSGQAKLVLWATGGLFAAFVTLLGAAWVTRRLARLMARWRFTKRFMSLRLALVATAAPGREVTSTMLSLGLGLTVLAAVGQIDANLQNAINQEIPERAPSFFVLDIQKDQMDAYMARLDADPSVSRIENAPMLRGIISQINSRPAKDIAGEHWVIRGDRGITYSADPPGRGEIVDGAWWPENYLGDPQISFAATEAEEIGLSLGDTMTLNILGREITATITSFRNVDFSGAGMGFVIILNPTALIGAPHSFISTVYAEQSAEAAILKDLTDQNPNITVINMREAIGRIGGILRAIAAAITYGALATLATGLVVMIGTAAVSERTRTYEAALLKTLGATRGTVLRSFLHRSLMLGFAAGAIAIFAGGVAGWAVIRFVMESDFSFSPQSAAMVVAIGVTISALSSVGFSIRSLNAKAVTVLRARE